MKHSANLLIVLMIFISFAKITTKTNSFPFEVQISGHGSKSIIFIPGFACSGDVWNETKTQYEKDYTCYTLTMAGFAGVKPQADASFKNWEAGIVNFIKSKYLNKPILIGHSMGGGLALAIAADYPDLIEKIIVVDALPCLSALMNPNFKANEINDPTAMVNQMTALNEEQFYQMQKRSIPQLVTDTLKQELVVNWSIKSDRKTFAVMYSDFLNTDLREKIKNITCPSLILLEPYFMNIKAAILEQYKNLKSSKLVYADKGLHFIMFDDKEWYLKQLNNFITAK